MGTESENNPFEGDELSLDSICTDLVQHLREQITICEKRQSPAQDFDLNSPFRRPDRKPEDEAQILSSQAEHQIDFLEKMIGYVQNHDLWSIHHFLEMKVKKESGKPGMSDETKKDGDRLLFLESLDTGLGRRHAA